MAKKATSVEDYFAMRTGLVRSRLEEIYGHLTLAAPGAEHVLKWGKPALIDNGILVVYAGHTEHISLHPTPSVVHAMLSDLDGYDVSENTIRFPVETVIPAMLIEKIICLRIYEKAHMGVRWR